MYWQSPCNSLHTLLRTFSFIDAVVLLQMFLLAGRSPTLLQLLCGLPFEYFSDPKYIVNSRTWSVLLSCTLS